MLKSRSNVLVDFEHYLHVRRPQKLPTPKGQIIILAAFSLLGALLLTAVLNGPEWLFLLEAGSVISLIGSLILLPRRASLSNEQRFLMKADLSAQTLAGLMRSRRLRAALHPGVASVLNECARSWRRVEAVCRLPVWSERSSNAPPSDVRASWLGAADLAMAEALILTQCSLTMRAPRSKTEEVIEDVLEGIGIGKRDTTPEPLPVEFAELRNLAEKMQMVAAETEQFVKSLEAEPLRDLTTTASSRLELVLTQMQARRAAEEELQQKI